MQLQFDKYISSDENNVNALKDKINLFKIRKLSIIKSQVLAKYVKVTNKDFDFVESSIRDALEEYRLPKGVKTEDVCNLLINKHEKWIYKKLAMQIDKKLNDCLAKELHNRGFYVKSKIDSTYLIGIDMAKFKPNKFKAKKNNVFKMVIENL